MPSAARQKTKGKRPPARPVRGKKPSGKPAKRSTPVPKKSSAPARRGTPPSSPPKAKEPEPELQVPLPDGRRHVLSLSFVRDGDEFLARLETDTGHITEFKNRSLDQLLTLVAGELEDLID